jgi:fructuronate reductase
MAVAAWLRWQGGRTDAGQAFEVDDPLAGETARLPDSPPDRVRAALALRPIFPAELAADRRFQGILTRQYDRLVARGAEGAIESPSAQG